ncbi:MAG: ABC transporter permease [Propionibacteriaceae bacterium]|nr:ABC transporter permease [Propionibacteriaceae bacterium]
MTSVTSAITLSQRAGLATATRLLVARQLRYTMRQPIWLASGLMTPLLYLALFSPLLTGLGGALAGTPGYAGGSVIDGFMPGLLVLFAFGTGMGAGWTVIGELNSGVIERFRVSPVPRLAILLGTTVKDAIMFIVPAFVVVAVAAIFGFDVHPVGLLLTFVLLAGLTAALSTFSAAVGLKMKVIGSLAAVITGLQLPLTLLSGVLLPMSLGPKWLTVLAHFNPMYYATDAARHLCAGQLDGTAWLGFGVIAAVLALALWWGTRVYSKAVA